MKKYHGIEEFYQKFQVAKDHNSKEIRLSIQEAERLGSAINLLLLKETELGDQIIELQKKVIDHLENQALDIDVTGGTF
jgi:hypothetical protein